MTYSVNLLKGGDFLRWYQRFRSAIKGAVTGWRTGNSDFTKWLGRTFWGSDNSTLATNETIFSVVSRLSNSLASLPLKMYKDFDVVMDKTADVLLNTPNTNMTSFEFMRNMETIRNEHGNAYALIQRDIRGQLESLWIIDPAYVEPVFDMDRRELWYQVLGDNGTYYVHNMDMLHVKHIVGAGGIKGINPIKVLTNTNDFDSAIRKFSLSEMESAKNSFILKYNTNVDKEKRQRVIDDFKRFYQENGGVLFQEPGVEIEKLDKKFISADVLAAERITRTRVANVYNMPVVMLNDTEGVSYANNEQLMRTYVQMTLLPIFRQYEQEFNRKLLTSEQRRNGVSFKFNVKGLLRGDTATQMEAYFKGIRSGFYKPNEVRAWEDLPPVKEGDKLYISGDLYPMDMDPTQRKGVNAGEQGQTTTK